MRGDTSVSYVIDEAVFDRMLIADWYASSASPITGNVVYSGRYFAIMDRLVESGSLGPDPN